MVTCCRRYGMEALSLDLRERICAACDEEDETRQEVADRFGVSRSAVQKLLRLRRKTGSIVAKPHAGGAEPLMNERDLARLRKKVQEKPDATLAELCGWMSESGGPSASVPTMCRALAGLRLPLKKRRCMRRSGIRRGYGRCAATGRSEQRRWTRTNWCSWTRAGSTPP